MNKITIIIPDLHHKWAMAEKIISHAGADEVIFLGDFLDDFDDTPEMVKDTCDWLVESVNKPNRIHLFGNHDIQYAFPYKTFQCSGYEPWKYFIAHDTIPRSTWDKVKWFHFLDDKWLLTHAGLHNLNVPDRIKKFSKNRKKFIAALTYWLDEEIKKGFNLGAESVTSWIFNAGRARWGQQRVGGITWCDFTQEFSPVNGINQIMGHTPLKSGPMWANLVDDGQKKGGRIIYAPHDNFSPSVEGLDDPKQSVNIDLDCRGNLHYATWDGKELKIGNYRDL